MPNIAVAALQWLFGDSQRRSVRHCSYNTFWKKYFLSFIKYLFIFRNHFYLENNIIYLNIYFFPLSKTNKTFEAVCSQVHVSSWRICVQPIQSTSTSTVRRLRRLRRRRRQTFCMASTAIIQQCMEYYRIYINISFRLSILLS